MPKENDRCDWCSGMGLITVYHRLYIGAETVRAEVVGREGEVFTVPMPGTILAHCTCGIGLWMRDRVEADIRRRIPTLAEILAGHSQYQLDRPDLDDEPELTPAAQRFFRRPKGGFTGRPLPRAAKSDPIQIANALRARTARIEAAEKGAPA